MIELHGIDGPAAEVIVSRKRPEDRGQQDASVRSLWVNFHMISVCSVPLGRVLRGDLGYTLQNYIPISEGLVLDLFWPHVIDRSLITHRQLPKPIFAHFCGWISSCVCSFRAPKIRSLLQDRISLQVGAGSLEIGGPDLCSLYS